MMKKDIFIDNNVAKNFTNPMDPEYKKLISWLLNNHEDESQKAYLAVSQKLISEYNASNRGAYGDTNIAVMIGTLQKQGRLNPISNREIKDFQRNYFSKKILRRLRCNESDRDHIPVVLLSDRKFAVTIDDDFLYDLTHFPGFIVKAAKRPEQIPYSL